MTRLAVLGVRLDGVRSGAHLTHLELAGYLAGRGVTVEYAALQGAARTRFGSPVRIGGPQMQRVVARADVVMVRDEPRVQQILPYCTRKPTIYTCHSPAGDPREMGLRMPGSATVVWVAENLKAHCEARHGAYPGENVVVDGLPIDPRRFRAPRGQHVTLVNLSERKGGALFWQLALRMPEVQFLGVLGWGEQLVPTRVPPNVKLLEKVQDPRAIYALTRVILLPSAEPGAVSTDHLPAWGEAWNRVGIEATCSGIPALASPVAGVRASLGDAAIWLDRRYPEAWEGTLRRLLAEPEFYDARSKVALAQARRVADRSSFIVDQYEQLLAAGVPA